MGRSAADAFESNTNVANAYDKLRIAPGELAPATVGWGIQSLGTYRGIPLYVYEAEYLNSAGAMTPYVPPDNVLVAASSLGGTMAYAGVAQVDASESGLSVFAGRRVPVVAFEALEDYRKFRLSSRPVPVPAEPRSLGPSGRPLKFNWRKLNHVHNHTSIFAGAQRDPRRLRYGPLGNCHRSTQACLWRLASRLCALCCRGRQWQVVTHCWNG